MASKDTRKIEDRDLKKVQGGAGRLGDSEQGKGGSQNPPDTSAPSTGPVDVGE